MILLALVFLPAVFGLLTLFFRQPPRRTLRRMILLAGAVFHFALTASLFFNGVSHRFNDFVSVDGLGLLFLAVTSLLFLLVSVYSFEFFNREQANPKVGEVSHLYTPWMLFFLSAMTLTALTTHLGLLWVAIEATTLASAPLIYYHHHERALEAAWKYLLICSVGIALALLGIFFMAAAKRGMGSYLFVSSFLENAARLDARWIKIGFLLVLTGFGTKMGLAPMHTWLPDAHSEAPSPVSALLSGALLNCAFLGILRCYQIGAAAGLTPFMGKLLTLFGLVSLFTAVVFIASQRDYKRLLAYSSVEHMGVLSLGLGVGAGFGTLLHLVNHSVAKALLFLTAGQILLAYRTKRVDAVQGLLKTMPFVGALFTLGSLAIMGSPPFAPFISEFLILREGFLQGHTAAMILYLVALGVIFVAMSRTVFGMVQGEKRKEGVSAAASGWLWAPMAALAGIVLLLGFYLPWPLIDFLREAARLLGGGS